MFSLLENILGMHPASVILNCPSEHLPSPMARVIGSEPFVRGADVAVPSVCAVGPSCVCRVHSVVFFITREKIFFPWSCSGCSFLDVPEDSASQNFQETDCRWVSTKVFSGHSAHGEMAPVRNISSWSFTVHGYNQCSCSDEAATILFNFSILLFMGSQYEQVLFFHKPFPEPGALPPPFWLKSTLLF